MHSNNVGSYFLHLRDEHEKINKSKEPKMKWLFLYWNVKSANITRNSNVHSSHCSLQPCCLKMWTMLNLMVLFVYCWIFYNLNETLKFQEIQLKNGKWWKTFTIIYSQTGTKCRQRYSVLHRHSINQNYNKTKKWKFSI